MTETGALAHVVVPGMYRDSVALMQMSSGLQRLPGVLSAGAVMATPANLDVLAQSGLVPTGLEAAPDDLLVVVRAIDAATAEAALTTGLTGIDGQHGSERPDPRRRRPSTVSEGMDAYPEANLVSVSVAGAYAPLIVQQALMSKRHVFCFSDNVTVEDEVLLKSIAAERGLLLMGPDCGTALIDGTPLGFVNAVSVGPVGIVSASGTGAQEVMCQLDAMGVGVSQVIGVGGRDLSDPVGGVMTHHALDLLEADEATTCIVLVGKPPSDAVAARLLARLVHFPKPVVACLIGARHREDEGSLIVAATLAEAASRAATQTGSDRTQEPDEYPAGLESTPGAILGLFTGGTLASEARHLLAGSEVAARIIDLGDDEFTVGRPHPMIDPRERSHRICAAAVDEAITVLLVDLVLGHGAMTDPASPLAEAVIEARELAASSGRSLTVIASVCGTTHDPQGLDSQRRRLVDAGILVAPSNATAARWARAAAGAVA